MHSPLNESDFEARVLAAAITAHHANRGYCISMGDHSQKDWEDAAEWQRESALSGARKVLMGQITMPNQSHESWMEEKVRAGWKHGEVKDEFAKTHPCILPWFDLPLWQQRKDEIFLAVCTAFIPF